MTYIDETEASSFWPDQAATPRTALSSQAALPQICLLLVTSEHPANFSRRDTDVSGRDISVGTDVLAQFSHKSNTEFPDLAVGFPLRIKVCATFAAAHVHLHHVRIVISRFEGMKAYILSRRF